MDTFKTPTAPYFNCDTGVTSANEDGLAMAASHTHRSLLRPSSTCVDIWRPTIGLYDFSSYGHYCQFSDILSACCSDSGDRRRYQGFKTKSAVAPRATRLPKLLQIRFNMPFIFISLHRHGLPFTNNSDQS